ncbi:MAG: single-stranded-DNA-specific exonuclease RecJ [Chloroflexota bacterium]
MKKWTDPITVTVPDDLREAVGGHVIVAERLVRQGIRDVATARRFLSADAYVPALSDALPDLDKAISRLQRAIRNGEQILVWGDFDVDGQTSTALLVSALRDLGAKVSYHVPNRFSEGHGIYVPTLKKLLDGGIELVVTCDTGISAHEAIDYAKSVGVDVVITDHHSLPETLPDAYATVNPMRLEEGHALRELPGVGTAYKVMQALYGNQSSDHLLDLVAMGIVADVMVQIDDTRYLLQKGLDVLRNSPRAGLKALMARADITPQDLTETDIGFGLAPRLNALGRLADANPAVELLTTNDSMVITELVNELEGLNQKRKYLTKQVYAGVQQQIEIDESLLKYATLVVAGEGWYTGVVGIVASRLVEDYDRPVLVLSESKGKIKGSARSVAGVNIVDAIRSQADLLDGFGGHNMAAGLSMPAENLFEFRRGLSTVAREMRGKADIEPTLSIDAYVDFETIDLAFADDIGRLAPFGNGNPPLTLATKNVEVVKRRTMGSRGDHLDLRLADENGNEQRVVWWFGDVDAVPSGKFDIAYTVRPNVFRGERSAMVEWLDVRPAEGASITLNTKPQYAVVDYRHHTNADALLAQVHKQYDDVLIWADGIKLEDAVDRYHLQEAETLVVWTIPCDVTVWKASLRTVQPSRLILFGQKPKIQTPKSLIETLIGMAKYALREKQGLIHMPEMASLTGHSEVTIREALRWINSHTTLTIKHEDDDLYSIYTDANIPKTHDIKRLSLLMKETAAYWEHWLKQDFGA